MRPCHCPDNSTISKQLDSIAEMVAEELLREAESEGVGERERTKRRGKELRENFLSAVTERGLSVDAILTALNSVLYDRLGFRETTSDSYYELDNCYIDRVRRCSTQCLSATWSSARAPD